MDSESPPIGGVTAAFGLMLCVYGLVQLGVVVFELLAVGLANSGGLVALVATLISGAGSLIGGWRWAGRKPAGPWLYLTATVHALVLALSLASLADGG